MLRCGDVLPLSALTLTLACLVQASEREPMAENMPETKLVLALHMSEKLIHGTQEHLSHSSATGRCVLPMGFMEQVCGCCTCLTPLLMACMQLVGALVVQAHAGLVPARISSMVLTRYYARIPFGNYEMELSRSRDARFISITLHADGATGLLAQVGVGSQCACSLSWLTTRLCLCS